MLTFDHVMVKVTFSAKYTATSFSGDVKIKQMLIENISAGSDTLEFTSDGYGWTLGSNPATPMVMVAHVSHVW